MWKNARKPNGPVSFRKRRREHRREGEPCYRYVEIYTAIAAEPKRRAESVADARTEEKTKTRGGAEEESTPAVEKIERLFFSANFHRETIFDIWTERNGD